MVSGASLGEKTRYGTSSDAASASNLDLFRTDNEFEPYPLGFPSGEAKGVASGAVEQEQWCHGVVLPCFIEDCPNRIAAV
jgi:hypothetical protein